MTEWTMIIMIVVSGWIKSVNIEQIYGFKSREACEVAAQEIAENYERKITIFCTPTDLNDGNLTK